MKKTPIFHFDGAANDATVVQAQQPSSRGRKASVTVNNIMQGVSKMTSQVSSAIKELSSRGLASGGGGGGGSSEDLHAQRRREEAALRGVVETDGVVAPHPTFSPIASASPSGLPEVTMMDMMRGEADRLQAEQDANDWIAKDFPLREIKKEYLVDADPSGEDGVAELNEPDVEMVALTGRVRTFLQIYDAEKMHRAAQMVKWAMSNSETALNAKLLKRFGSGLPLPRRKLKRGGGVAGSGAGSFSSGGGGSFGGSGSFSLTLREELVNFFAMNPSFVPASTSTQSVVDDLITFAKNGGSLEDEMKRRYGKTLAESSRDLEAIAKVIGNSASKPSITGNKQGSFMEVPLGANDKSTAPGILTKSLSESSLVHNSNQAPTYSRGDEEIGTGNMRADLEAFYIKHDPTKLIPSKFEPIVAWATKLGIAEVDAKFQGKYGESLSAMIEAAKKGLPGATPTARRSVMIPAGMKASAGSFEEAAAADGSERECENYREGTPGSGFGVCGECGLSRADHHYELSLFEVGNSAPKRPARSDVATLERKGPPI